MGSTSNYTSVQEIRRRFVYDSKDDGISRSYIFGYERDNPSYEFLKTRIFCEKTTQSTSEETVYTLNLDHAKRFFVERLTGCSLEELERVYTKVTQQLLFNIFTISEDVDVCVAFETMNNRGKPLSYLELLKNRLIYLSLKFDTESYEKDKLRRAINDCWKAIYHNLGRNKERPLDDDRFLLNHYVIYFGNEFVGEHSQDEVRRYGRLLRADYASHLLETKFIAANVTENANSGDKIELKDVYDYVSSLQQHVDCWYRIFNPQDSEFSAETRSWLERLNRLGKGTHLPLVMVALDKGADTVKCQQLLKSIERRQFLSSFYGYMYLDREDIHEYSVVRWAIKLDRGEISIEEVIKQISESTNEFLKRASFVDDVARSFKSGGFYRWSKIRYFLYEYNQSLQNRSKTMRRKIEWMEFCEHPSDYISVEHIYPQRARHEYWKSRFGQFTSKQRSALRHSLGNLLPLSKPKNASLSNKPFPDKVDGKKDVVVGYRYGCYAENEVTECMEWTPDEILKRGIRLLEFMEERWDFKLGERSKKIQVLGLPFLEKKPRAKKSSKSPSDT